MERSKALKYAVEIARRVHEVNGLIPTPDCGFEGMLMSNIWVFGSTAKGSEFPNDLDVLIDWKEHGRQRRCPEVSADKGWERRYGRQLPKDSRWPAMKWLTKGMRGVSRHDLKWDEADLDVKKLIYPVYEMDLV